MTVIPGYANISLGDARELFMYIEKQEILKDYSFPTHPGKDGYYRIYVSDPTKKAGRRQLFSRDLDELREKVYEYEKGMVGRVRKTFKETYDLALSEKLRYTKDPDRQLSRQNTVSVCRSNYRRFFDGTGFESMYMDTITKSDIEGIIFYNLDRYSLRTKAFNALKGILNAAFTLAYEEYWITDNVFSRVRFDKFAGMIAPDVDIEKRVHSSDEVSRILDELHRYQHKKPAYMPAYALEMQIITGARRGEIPPLRRSDVHDVYISICREQITVKKNGDVPTHYKIVEHTKTYRDRYFPRSRALNEFLGRLYASLDKFYPDSPYLFPDRTENGVIHNSTPYRLYERICHRLGIKISRDEIKGTHSFRRNAITDVVNASGGNVILAAKLFGNSPDVATKNYYTGIDTKEALKVLNKRKLS